MAIGLRDLSPPIVTRLARRMVRVRLGDDIFDGQGDIFKDALSDCDVYGEYGMGASTRWVLDNTNAKVIAVDTSTEWVDRVVGLARSPDRLASTWIDVGPIGNWGWPLNYSKRDNFLRYMDALWIEDSMPGVVLIDGRFRVCCFLTTLLNAAPGTRIVFDDYTNRPHYHIVEEIVTPSRRSNRQALFHVPESIDRDHIMMLRDRFLFVRD